MKNIIITALTLFVLSTVSVYAGGSHSHSHGKHSHDNHSIVTEEQLLINAQKVVKKIVSKGKLDASWSDIKPHTAEKIESPNDADEWKVTFKNPKLEDKSKRTLYVFMDLKGEYIAANHTGN